MYPPLCAQKSTSKLISGLICAFLFVIMLVCVGCSGTQDDGKLHEGYYREMAMKANGEFVPQGKLSDSEAAKAGIVYKVEMDKEHKDQVKKITSMYKGKTIRVTSWRTTDGLWHGQFASITVTPQDNGFVQYAFYDAYGEKCAGFFSSYSMRFKSDDKAKDDKGKLVKAAYLYNKNGENKIGKSSDAVSQLLFSYDKNNRLSKISMANENGSPVKATSLGGGNATALQITYDQKKENQVNAISWVNDGGNLVKAAAWAKQSFKYDDKGRIIEKAHFGADDSPIDVKGSTGLSALYGLNKPEAMLNGLMEAKEGYITGGAVTKYTYDEKGMYPTKVAFFGKAGQSYGMEYNNKIAEVDLSYDEFGNVTKMAVRGADGNLKAFTGKIDSIALTYDEQGSIAKEIFYHGDNPTPLEYGRFKGHNVSEIDYTYDDHGRVASESYYDAAGAPTDLKLYGSIAYQKQTFTYKDDGTIDQKLVYSQDGTEVKADPLEVLYGRYKVINPTNIGEKIMIMEFAPNKVIVTMDADMIKEYEEKKHTTFTPKTENVVLKATIDEETGKGKVYVDNASLDIDASAGTLSDGNTKMKKIK